MTPTRSDQTTPQHTLASSIWSASSWLCTTLLVGLFLLIGFGSPVNEYDESIPLYSARLIASGLKVHTDFTSLYPPLVYYMDAAAFRILGFSVIVHRLLEAAWFLLLICLVAWVARRRPDWRGASPFILFCFSAAIGKNFISGPWIAFAAAFAAVLLYFGRAAAGPPGRLFLLVVATGVAVATLCRINFGVYAYGVIATDLALDALRQTGKESPSRLLRSLAAQLACLTAPVAFFLGVYLWPYGAHYQDVLRQLFYVHSVSMNSYRFIPVALDPWICYALMFPCVWFFLRVLFNESRALTPRDWLPLAAAVLIAGVVFASRQHPQVVRNMFVIEFGAVLALNSLQFRLNRIELGLMLFYCMILHYFLSRSDEAHFAMLLPVAALILPFALTATPSIRRARAGLILAGCVLLTMPLTLPVRDRGASRAFRLLRSGAWGGASDASRLAAEPLGVPPIAAIYPDFDVLQAVRYVRERTREDEAVYVGLASHSRGVWVNSILAYWLLERPPAVKDYWFEPSLTTDALVQQGMIDDLKRRSVRWLILQQNPDGPAAESASGSKRLDEYLAREYVADAHFGQYSVLRQAAPK